MSNITVHFVYLHSEVKNEQWKYLHNYFHPGTIEHEGQYVLIGKDLDISHHVFARILVKDWKIDKSTTIYFPYNLIAGIREALSHKPSLGFIDASQSLSEIETEGNN